MSKNVHYEKPMRERATREGKFLVTVSVDGRHIKDDSMTVQGLADVAMAKRLSKVAMGLFKKRVGERSGSGE